LIFVNNTQFVFQAYSSLGTSDSKLNLNLLQNEIVAELALNGQCNKILSLYLNQ
jgi:hypothetical protein